MREVFAEDVLSLRQQALIALQAMDAARKSHLIATAQAQLSTLLKNVPADNTKGQNISSGIINSGAISEPDDLPGHPAKPELRAHLDIERRSIHTPLGLAQLLHAVAHIEFNAINLALDAVWRFDAMPLKYYADWLQVAHEEAYHFNLLQDLLQSMGHHYGDFAAHTGLWDMTERTKGDITARMALVPRTLEARGLDATPPMQAKLRKLGNVHADKAVAILDIILHDEIGHVRVGNHWYAWLCAQQGLEPITHYRTLSRQYQAPRLRAPFNLAARAQAGFTQSELHELQTAQP